MASPYTISRAVARGLYRLIPSKIRRLSFLERLSERISRGLQRFATRDEIYTSYYFERFVEGPAKSSAPTIVKSIVSGFKPARVVDVGCGTGALLDEFKNKGCDCLGLEYSEPGIKMCRARGLDVLKFDLEQESLGKDMRIFDVAISMEVAEHLRPQYADRFVDLLTSLAPVVVFTAATPGQGGDDHVNEQPHTYWIEKFELRRFRYQQGLSDDWRQVWKNDRVATCYYRNLMIFIQP
jgi:SAM-dependent methyltransferase